MDKILIIVLNVVVVLCFVTFFISTFRAFEGAANKENPNSAKRGIISRFLTYLQSLVND